MKKIILAAFLGANLISASVFGMNPEGPSINFGEDIEKTYTRQVRQDYIEAWELGKFSITAPELLEYNCRLDFSEDDRDSRVLMNSLLLRAICERPTMAFVSRGKVYQMNNVDIDFNSPFYQYNTIFTCCPLLDGWSFDHGGIQFFITKLKIVERKKRNNIVFGNNDFEEKMDNKRSRDDFF